MGAAPTDCCGGGHRRSGRGGMSGRGKEGGHSGQSEEVVHVAEHPAPIANQGLITDKRSEEGRGGDAPQFRNERPRESEGV